MKPVSPPPLQAPLELWGGVECTLNRVGDQYHSQLAWSGHLRRIGDLDLFAELRMTSIRYPVLWEMLSPTKGTINWQWADQRLDRLRALGIRPIIGLVHHGAGPRHASVETPLFAPCLAEYAGAVARRFPWVDAYTPVNEPLTTARFSGLYRLWHPHGGDQRTFLRVLLHECKGTILAMRAIRAINPGATLIQPDDLGRIFGTAEMAAEIEFQNHRRWLGWDLLCGRVDARHPLWRYLLANGATERELDWFSSNRCPPDVIGINHYPTSDRYLDHKVGNYPGLTLTRDTPTLHADLEAVRVRTSPPGGFYARLTEAWERYKIPLAITECHLGCTREEQVRWFAESWDAAERARADSVQIGAVTAWALLGSHNWNSLVTRDTGYYEPGAFDVRGSVPRPTAVAAVLRSLGSSQELPHPLLAQPGWWHRPDRFRVEGVADTDIHGLNRRIPQERAAPLLIIGGSSSLGSSFILACKNRGLDFKAPGKMNPHALHKFIHDGKPWAVVNAGDAGDPLFSLSLAEACRDAGSTFLCFSSAEVFDGKGKKLYLESDPTIPNNAYGRSMAAMEDGVLKIIPKALIIRSGPCFREGESRSIMAKTLGSLRVGRKVVCRAGDIVSPTYVPDLVEAALDVLIDGAAGIWHLANSGQRTWLQATREVAQLCGFSPPLEGLDDYSARFSALGTEKGQILPSFEDAILRYSQALKRTG
ncbi:sugar nucleotide-binding protein [Luteolibacter sp. GHJ8]|uniref:dTDP-4-dehydrorhamnose reductase n=1 Tax=Luteolibacter rhizosphaerae TaxID=2989719 RepID=A0ABT3G043_9BACT|nr:family 1 glycosylhydrolase [Luteolibacter rhizosphaerae]MCW1912954.1 sugar nucleotide-binding protein [Luteolibacter rhizosphaerae]